MLDLYYWPTPNGKKIAIMLEECKLAYKLVPVNISKGEQKTPDFLKVNPNGRIPAIIDRDAGASAVFESGAILIYLAEKTGQFLPALGSARYDVLGWLMWQMGGLGPMAGQASHFLNAAPEPVPYATNRFTSEVKRLYGVLDAALNRRDYVAGDYSIADMAIYPWIVPYIRQGQEMSGFPALKAWMDRMQSRPAVQAGMDAGSDLKK